MQQRQRPSTRLDYEAAKAQARDTDAARRAALADRADVSPEILAFLAADTAVEVRRRLAGNVALPKQVDLALTRDPDEAVRATLVDKTVACIPPNTAPAPAPLERLTLQVLAALAADRSAAVRGLLAEAVKDLVHAPRPVVQTLARDPDIAVAEPILRHTPQLNEDDLVDLARESAGSERLGAIAKRSNLSSRVADVIARTQDTSAVAALLSNKSAQIREDTLDFLLEKAPAVEQWHEPLVRREDLQGPAIGRLAQFVTMALVEVLAVHPAADPATARRVAETLRCRLERGGLPITDADLVPAGVADAVTDAAAAPAPADGEPASEEDELKRVYAEARAGRVGEEDIDDAIFAGKRPYVLAALAGRARIPVSTADRILASQSARGVVALVWRAKLSMRFAVKLQLQVARIAPRSVVNPGAGDTFPMTPEEMRWQLEFFGAED